MQRTDYAILGWIAAALVACSSSGPVNIGDDSAQAPAWARGLGGTYSTDPIKPPAVDPSFLQAGTVPRGCEGRQEPFNPTISYRGYIQNYQSGASRSWPSEVVILKFTELTTSAVRGRVLSDQVGAGNYIAVDSQALDGGGGSEGFQFTISDASFDGRRLRFTINLYEAYCAWCGQQTPIEQGASGYYMCTPQTHEMRLDPAAGCALLSTATGKWEQWSCDALMACTGICACSADGCTAEPNPLAFDLVMNGDQLTGAAGDLGNAVLNRETS